MPEIVLGSDVPHLIVILQSGVTQSFGIIVEVEPADLVGVEGRLDFGEIEHIADLTDTTYIWTFTAEDVAELNSRDSVLLSLENDQGRTLLGRGIVEIRS